MTTINAPDRSRVVLEKIINYMTRMSKPTYLGYVSLEIGYGLAKTQEFMEQLQFEGVLRPLTDKEKIDKKVDVRANLWIVVEHVK